MRTLVVSLNPAVDCEWVVETFQPLEKNEVHSERRWPGGKGINVARWLTWLGEKPALFVPVGGAPGVELLAGLKREKLKTHAYNLGEPTRVNVIVTQSKGGPQYRLNPLWPRFSAAEQRGVFKATQEAIERSDRVVLSGALPRTMPVDTYARLIAEAKARRKVVVLDCDGEAFRLGASQGPDLVKPNESELAQWCGRTLRTRAQILGAATELSQTTGGWVVVSLGPDGALLVHAKRGVTLHEPAKAVEVRNTVGAGDAMLAAILQSMSLTASPRAWLKAGVRIGTTATQVAPGTLPPRRTVRRSSGRQ